MSKNHRILDDELFEYITALDPKEQENWLFLTPHPEYPGRWYVDSLHSGFLFDFIDLIGKYRVVSPASLSKFFELAESLQYDVAFTDDPLDILQAWDHLNDPPAFKLNSNLHFELEAKGEHHAADVVRQTGMLPWQVQGFNYLRRPELRAGLALWSTGTGKTVLLTALLKQHMEIEKAYDLGLVVVKKNNKFDTQMKLKQLGNLESFIIDGRIERRGDLYYLFDEVLDTGQPLIGIINYEKFRDDQEFFHELVEDRRVLVGFDEMPMKLRNRTTELYKSVCSTLYTSAPSVSWDSLRPAALRTYQFSATPIEQSPEDQLNCIRLQDPEVFPSTGWWGKQFVASRNPISHKAENFKNLEKMGLMLDFMTHQVDKEDPDIARMFPEVNEIPVYIDWHPKDREVYEKLQKISKDLVKQAKEDPEVKTFNALQLIWVLQMLCNAPSMVAASATNRVEFEAMLEDLTEEEGEQLTPDGSEAALTLVNSIGKKLTDEWSTKLDKLKELILVKHPDEKIIVFSRMARYIQPVLEKKFKEWGVSYVVFRGTDKQRQEAKERFRNDPDIQIFLSSDTGSDSIDLPEASVVIHYDLPLKWSVKIQRQNRAHRVNSKHESVTFYVLMMANSVEQRIEEIIEKKYGFHLEVFKGVTADEHRSARMTGADIWYLITGEEYEDDL